ncbi:POK6 protein, partial [Galbula dea]|nr:POK6 protein [Galbula dea]
LQTEWIQVPKCSLTPIQNGLTVFTDAGKASRRAAIMWQQDGQWQHHILSTDPGDNLQTLELTAICWAVSNWLTTPLNVITDSLYVAGVAQRIEDSFLKDTQNQRLGELFL